MSQANVILLNSADYANLVEKLNQINENNT